MPWSQVSSLLSVVLSSRIRFANYAYACRLVNLNLKGFGYRSTVDKIVLMTRSFSLSVPLYCLVTLSIRAITLVASAFPPIIMASGIC